MIKIFNTYSGTKEDFYPIKPNQVQMYVCGPTTYDYFHIGNGRAFLFFDVVRRYFEYSGYKVTYIQNITDIDDKIINKANEQETTINKIAAKYIKAFREDTQALGIKRATHYPKATGYVSQMIDFIEGLENDGYAYKSADDVYFSVQSVPDYGKLSGKNIQQLLAGARVEENTHKRFTGDFVLWKRAKTGEPSWDSPWGKGRPGWHTECVVMAKDLLKLENNSESTKKDSTAVFDIHAGGIDLVFPHHENEIAQARAAINSQLANYWMHNGFINIEGEKMSKSLGNFFTVRDILKKYNADTIRHFYLSKHYRSPIDYNEEILRESVNAVKKLHHPLQEFYQEQEELPKGLRSIKEYEDEFRLIMDDDFNTARAIALLFDLVKEINTAKSNRDRLIATHYKLGKVLGFFSSVSASSSAVEADNYSSELIELLISYRAKFKQEKNWLYADMIREDLAKIGIMLQDTPEGTKWHKAE